MSANFLAARASVSKVSAISLKKPLYSVGTIRPTMSLVRLRRLRACRLGW